MILRIRTLREDNRDRMVGEDDRIAGLPRRAEVEQEDDMIYLIGGAARTGKTMLARRLLQERNIPYFCVDYFVSALDQGAPELGIEAESPNRVRAQKLWPRIAPMLRNIIEVEPEYTVEGDALWPAGVASLIQEYGAQVRACFLGYTNIAPERKLTEIRRFGGCVNDWIQDQADAYILALVQEMVEFSRFVRDECRSLGIPYFDVSDDFPGVLEQVFRMLETGYADPASRH